MNHEEKIILLKIILFLVLFVAALIALNVLWAREQVKKDLLRQTFAPISIRWIPFGFWAWPATVSFRVTFIDAFGCIQNARCSVWFNDVRWRG